MKETFISGIERGVRHIGVLKLWRIASALNIRVRDLFDDFYI